MDVAYLPTFDPATHEDYCLWRVHEKTLEQSDAAPARAAAWELLNPFLTITQEITLRRTQVMLAIGSEGGRYLFYHDGLWTLADEPRFVCFHPPTDEFPGDDVILTKFLWLTSDEAKFRWYANFQQHRYAQAYKQVFDYELTRIAILVALNFALGKRWITPGIPRETTIGNIPFLKDELKRAEDLYADHPRLLWRMVKRYWDYMAPQDQELLAPGLENGLAKAEAKYAR